MGLSLRKCDARRLPAVCLFLCAALLSTSALADQALRQAQRHYRLGQRHYRLARFEEALEAFSKAYEYKPRPGVLFNIGQCHKKLKDYERAIHFYNGFVRKRPHDKKAVLARRLRREMEQKQTHRLETERLLEEQERLRAELQKAKVEIAQASASANTEQSPLSPWPNGNAQVPPLGNGQGSDFDDNGQGSGVDGLSDGVPVASDEPALVEFDFSSVTAIAATKSHNHANLSAALTPPPSVHTAFGTEPPIYQEWWFWGTAAGVVAVSVGAIFIATSVNADSASSSDSLTPATTVGVIDRR